jgi:hypothetical protein
MNNKFSGRRGDSVYHRYPARRRKPRKALRMTGARSELVCIVYTVHIQSPR